MTNTVIFMTLGYLRICHTTAVLFSPLHIWIRILVVYVVKISCGRRPEHPSGKTPDECVFIAYYANIVIFVNLNYISMVIYIFKFLIWRPIYRQPVYVGIYLPLALAHSNYQLETKKHNLKSFCKFMSIYQNQQKKGVYCYIKMNLNQELQL
jgi:hypothetical protein